jgi:hypothetical protein
MQIPEISSETKDISLVEWEKCTDIVCLNNGNKIKYAEFETDSDLAVIRMNPERSSLISFSVVNGSYLKYKNKNIIKLRGGPGTASWSGKKLVISGKNVYNFEFTFPSHSESGFFDFMIPGKTDRKLTGVKAQGLNIKVIKTGNTWSAETPFISRETLSW